MKKMIAVRPRELSFRFRHGNEHVIVFSEGFKDQRGYVRCGLLTDGIHAIVPDALQGSDYYELYRRPTEEEIAGLRSLAGSLGAEFDAELRDDDAC